MILHTDSGKLRGLMELLVLLLGEALFVPFLAALAALVEGLVALLGLAMQLLLRVFRRHAETSLPTNSSTEPLPPAAPLEPGPAPAPRAHTPPPRPRGRPDRIARGLVLAGLAALLLCAVVLTLLDLFWFESTVRGICNEVASKTGHAIQFKKASGSLWTGSLRLEEIQVQSRPDSSWDTDLELDLVDLELDVTSLLSRAVQLEHLHLEGLRGAIRWPPARPRKRRLVPTINLSWLREPRRHFIIRSLRLQGVELELGRKGEEETRALRVPEWHTAPFRSRFGPLDFLLRSRLEGSYGEGSLAIHSEEIDGGRRTEWRATNLPVEALTEKLGGSLALLKKGRLDLEVRDRWTREPEPEIDSQWKLTFRALHSESRLLRAAIRRFGSKTLEFGIRLEGGRFRFESESNSEAFWQEVGKRILARLLGRD